MEIRAFITKPTKLIKLQITVARYVRSYNTSLFFIPYNNVIALATYFNVLEVAYEIATKAFTFCASCNVISEQMFIFIFYSTALYAYYYILIFVDTSVNNG